jgi:hypothetical protein
MASSPARNQKIRPLGPKAQCQLWSRFPSAAPPPHPASLPPAGATTPAHPVSRRSAAPSPNFRPERDVVAAGEEFVVDGCVSLVAAVVVQNRIPPHRAAPTYLSNLPLRSLAEIDRENDTRRFPSKNVPTAFHPAVSVPDKPGPHDTEAQQLDMNVKLA